MILGEKERELSHIESTGQTKEVKQWRVCTLVVWMIAQER